MKTKEFFDYLFYVGVITEDTFPILASIVEKKTKGSEKANIDKNIFMKSLMSEYFKSLDEEKISKIGENIYIRYNTNKNLTISKHLHKLLYLKETFLQKKIYKYFLIWKKNLLFPRNRPKIMQKSQSTDKLMKNNYLYNNYTSKHSNIYSSYYSLYNTPDFYARLANYKTKKEKDNKKAQIMNDDDNNINCTFTPNLSLTQKKNNNIKSKPKKKNKPNSIKVEEKTKKKVDNDRMSKLYNDFQRKNLNKEILQKNIDIESGITFSPKLNSNSQYNKNIKENFFERNQKMLEDKKDFINGFNYLRDLQMKGVDINVEFMNLNK